MLKAASIITICLLAASAWAQQPITQADPRISGPLIQSLQGQIAFYEALIKAQREDAGRREADWAEYSKPLWQPLPPQISEAK